MSSALRFSALCADLLQAGIAVRFTATGPSMAPTIRDGDVVTVVPLDSRRVAEGEIVLYRNARGLTAHRVTATLGGPGEVCRVQGASAGSEAERVGRVQIFGRLTAVERTSWLRRSVRLQRLVAALAAFRPFSRFGR
jgi:hypothetical protein